MFAPGRFNPAFRLRDEGLAREPQLAGLLVNINKLHLNSVTFLEELFNSAYLLPVHLRDVQQSILVRENLNKRTKLCYGFHLAGIDLSYLRNGAYSVDTVKGRPDNFVVLAKYIDHSLTVGLLNNYGCTCGGLNILYNLSAGAYHSTDHLLGYKNLLYSRCMRLEVRPGLGNGLFHDVEDMHSATARLFERLFENLERKAVNLDVHLCGSNAIAGACDLEIHIAEMVFITEYI